jgi:hypothetical protein
MDFCMELKFYLYCLADLALIVTSFICGVKYFRKRNGLLGFESLVLTLVSTQIIASVYDFYPIPGDSDHMIFYIFALLSWSYMSVSLYYAYCALERVQEKEGNLIRGYTLGRLERNPR